MDLQKRIQEKIEQLNQIVQQIQLLQQNLVQLNQEALKLDGAINELKELKKLDTLSEDQVKLDTLNKDSILI
jgi:prefoldin subunit 5